MRAPAALLLCGLLLACTDPNGAQSPFDEVGASLNNNGFGAATAANITAMTDARSARISLAGRFAQEVETTVNFAFDSAVLDAEAQAILRRQADWIRQFPEVRFSVYGHADAVGAASYNYAIGLRRAEAVVAFLATQGISRSRLQALVSEGENQPLIVTQGRERANRRTVTEVSGFIEGQGGVMDGKYAQVIYREYIASAVPPRGVTSASTLTGN